MFEYTQNAINNILFGDWMEYNLCPSEDRPSPDFIKKFMFIFHKYLIQSK